MGVTVTLLTDSRVAGPKRSCLPMRILPCYVICSTFHLSMVAKDCSCYMNLIG